MRHPARALVLVPLVALPLALTSCAGSEPLADATQNTANTGFVAGDGSTTSFAPQERTAPVEFSGTDEHGNTVDSVDYAGQVTVVNFWYAGCAPCRAEAADLVAVATEYSDAGVKFLGVNTRDQVAQAQQFAAEFQVPYPSIIDAAQGRATQAAFAAQVPLNAVPTTLVLDAEGRVAHRVLGQLASASQLKTLVKETLAEQAAATTGK